MPTLSIDTGFLVCFCGRQVVAVVMRTGTGRTGKPLEPTVFVQPRRCSNPIFVVLLTQSGDSYLSDSLNKMQQIVNSLLAYLSDNWPELVWIVAAAGVASYLAGSRSRSRWQRRDFLDRLNVSLTSLRDGQLKIRTVLEMDVHDVFLNRSAASRIVELAKGTTERDPIIPIPAADRWYYLNSVLNEISERFAAGLLRRDAGLSVASENYLICLTCERAGDIRTQKIRAMMVRRELLEGLPAEEPTYESPNHANRWRTLQVMAERWRDDPDQFLAVEICL
jgi:hypothetical protein